MYMQTLVAHPPSWRLLQPAFAEQFEVPKIYVETSVNHSLYKLVAAWDVLAGKVIPLQVPTHSCLG